MSGTALRTACGLIAIVAFALALRVLFPYPQVFRTDGVRMTDIDASYHLRITENLAANFPERLELDPFAHHPGGQWVQMAPLLDYLAASAAIVLGGGRPRSPEQVAAVAAWIPALLGSLTVIPLFLLGRAAFGARTGWLAAFLLAFQPGHFLQRSLLGVFDHHVLESLTSCLCLFLLATAVTARSESVAWSRLRVVGAGAALAAYVASWSAGIWLPALLGAWMVLCSLHSLWTGERAASAKTALAAVIALAILLPFAEHLPRFDTLRFLLVALAAGGFLLAILEAATRRLRWSPWRALAAAGAIGAAALGVLVLEGEQLGKLGRFFDQLRGGVEASTVGEAKPLLELLGPGPWWRPFWVYYGTTAFVALPAFLVLCVSRSRMNPARLLVILWTLASLALTLAQNRFGYYLSLPLALLAAWSCDAVIGLAEGSVTDRRYRAAAWIIVILLVVYPNLGPAIASTRAPLAIPDGWRNALLWMREKTPAPYGPDDYWANPARSRELATTGAGYGVLAWWDYGWWIAQIARRPPLANPTQTGAAEAARLLLEPDPELAAATLSERRARYVIVDGDLVFGIQPLGSFGGGKFDALPLWTGRKPERYREVLELRSPDGSRGTLPVLYPDYYRTLLARLYLFGGRAVEPRGSSFAIELERGVVIAVRQFEREEEARAFVDEGAGRDRRLVGLLPGESPVALEAAARFELVYDSPVLPSGPGGPPALRIFALR